jgi:hypothetical protein
MIEKSKDINHLVIGVDNLPLGITVSTGPGLYMVWAAWALLLVSIFPYMVRCVNLLDSNLLVGSLLTL